MSQQINLYNPILLRQKKIFSARAMAQSLIVLVLGILVFYGYARYQVASLQSASSFSEKRLENAQARFGRLSQQFSPPVKSAALDLQISQVETDLKKLTQTQVALKQSGALEGGGFSPYFQAMARQIVDGLWLTGIAVESGDMRISGRALKPELVPIYIRRLSTEPAMRGRQFSTLEMHQPLSAETQAGKPGVVPAFIEFSLQSALKAPEKKP